MFVMVCYDVPAKRTDLYKKLLKEFLIHEQASVFMGDLPESEIVKLVARISKKIGPKDRVLKLVCKNRHNVQVCRRISKKIGPKDRVLKLVCKNRHNVQVCRLSKEALGGQMRQDEDDWHGKDWALV